MKICFLLYLHEPFPAKLIRGANSRPTSVVHAFEVLHRSNVLGGTIISQIYGF